MLSLSASVPASMLPSVKVVNLEIARFELSFSLAIEVSFAGARDKARKTFLLSFSKVVILDLRMLSFNL